MDLKIVQTSTELEKIKNLDQKQYEQQIQNQKLFNMNNSDLESHRKRKSQKDKITAKNPIKNEKTLTSINSQKYSQQKISKIIKNKKNKQTIQEEYNPFQKRKKCESTTKQNQNRNIIPNQVNQIFSYIQKSSKSILVVNRIFSKYPPPNPEYNTKRFYLYQSLLKQKVSNYINESSLSLVTDLYEPRCEVYPQQQQRYYNKICRILIHHFLQEDSIFNILTSRRMHKEKKRNHLEMRRILKSKAIQILKH